jgi:catechol 2,3-dioxygenase-like lactoylglutathione lyase family enzyme
MTLQRLQLRHTIIVCQNIEEMTRFYHEVLGFPIDKEDQGYWAALRVGETLLGLRTRGKGHQGVAIFDGDAPQNSRSIQLTFHVSLEQLDQYYAYLQQNSVMIIQPPTDQDGRHRTLFFADPEGNLLEIYTHV